MHDSVPGPTRLGGGIATRRRFGPKMLCLILLVVLYVQQIVGPVSFDPSNCSQTSPCCISSDVTLSVVGSNGNTFCDIEYPVRSTVQWNTTVAYSWDKQAKAMVKNLTALGCDPEACTVKSDSHPPEATRDFVSRAMHVPKCFPGASM